MSNRLRTVSRAIVAAKRAAALMRCDPRPAIAAARATPYRALTIYEAIVRSFGGA